MCGPPRRSVYKVNHTACPYITDVLRGAADRRNRKTWSWRRQREDQAGGGRTVRRDRVQKSKMACEDHSAESAEADQKIRQERASWWR